MKKILSAIMLMALAGLGLVAVSEAPANAAYGPCGYAACTATTTTVSVPGKVKAGKAVPIRVTVTAASNVIPTGKVTVVVTKSNGKVKYISTQAYAGGTLTFVTQGLRHGYYTATATYTPAGVPGSKTNPPTFSGSSGSASFHAKKKHHHHRR